MSKSYSMSVIGATVNKIRVKAAELSSKAIGTVEWYVDQDAYMKAVKKLFDHEDIIVEEFLDYCRFAPFEDRRVSMPDLLMEAYAEKAPAGSRWSAWLAGGPDVLLHVPKKVELIEDDDYFPPRIDHSEIDEDDEI